MANDMSESLSETVALIGDVFSESPVLREIGFDATNYDLLLETPTRCDSCLFHFSPAPRRRMTISFSYLRLNKHFFTVEIFNTAMNDSFLLCEWMRLKDAKVVADPFSLSAYSGTLRERLTAFVRLLEAQFQDAAFNRILTGRDWQHIPY